MEQRERFKVEDIGGDYCDFEESNVFSDAFELFDSNDYPEEERKLIEEFNRRAKIGNQRYRIAMYRAEMFEKGFNAGMYICTFDHDENMTSFVFTDEARRMLGYNGLEDLPNEFDSWVKTLLPEQREAMIPIFWNTVKSHRQLPDISHAEYPMMRKDGKIIWVTGAGRFIRRADDSLEIYMGCYRDVTAEHEKNDYLHIVEGIEKIFIFSLFIDMANETYQVISTNEYVEKGKKGPNAFQFLRDNVELSVRPEFKADMNAWFQRNVIESLLKENETVTKDFCSLAENRWFRATFMVGDKNEDGSLKHIIYGCQEITDSKRIELKQKEELADANDNLKIINEKQNAHLEEITELNRNFSQQLDIIGSLASTFASIYYIDMYNLEYYELGKSGDRVRKYIQNKGNADYGMKMMCQYIVAPEYVEEMRKFTDLKTLNERLKDRIWISKQFQAGSGRWDEGIFIVAKRDEQGNCLNVMWAVRDINEMKLRENEYQRELEQARDKADAANAAKTSFLFNMSHDIRTPMNAIVGFTDLIEKHYDDKEKCMNYLHKTKQANQFLLSLINDVLEMARIESGKASLDVSVSPVGGIAQESADIFEEQIAQKGITFETHIHTHTKWAYYDQTKVRKIYLNILSNAIKYTPTGGKITMQVDELPSNQPGYIKMKAVFSDTGIGMSKEFLPHLFESFTRERTSTESRQQGTGLGMPIVKSIIGFMGGTIDVESELGKGSTFIVTYPLQVANEMPDEDKVESQKDTADFKGKRILLAEDNDLNAEIATEILNETGFEVERAADGKICIDMLQQAPDHYYDAILMDIQMPNMDGYTATKEIRKMEDSYRNNIPIIAMTANAFESDRQDALAAGMNAHIAKPIEIPKLMETLSKFIVTIHR